MKLNPMKLNLMQMILSLAISCATSGCRLFSAKAPAAKVADASVSTAATAQSCGTILALDALGAAASGMQPATIEASAAVCGGDSASQTAWRALGASMVTSRATLSDASGSRALQLFVTNALDLVAKDDSGALKRVAKVSSAESGAAVTLVSGATATLLQGGTPVAGALGGQPLPATVILQISTAGTF